MKSILQEASSVFNAVQKAWEEAGKPTEFTVKVLEPGQKNFFGFTKRPAIISLTYVPQAPRQESYRGQDRRQSGKPRDNQQRQPMPVKRDRRRVDELRPEDRPQQSRDTHPRDNRDRRPNTPEKEVVRPLREQTPREHPVREHTVREPIQRSPESYDVTWTPEHVATIKTWLDDILAIMNITVPFTLKEDQRTLVISFESRVIDGAEEESMLFASFSYLLLQGLKKKNKNKFKGFRILLRSQR